MSISQSQNTYVASFVLLKIATCTKIVSFVLNYLLQVDQGYTVRKLNEQAIEQNSGFV